MKLQTDILKCLLPALMLSVASCVTEDIDSCPEDPEQSGNWITLQFYVSEESSVTRANPQGGEDGNGREEEICNEAKIHDVNIFLFADNASKLLNAASNTTLTHLYFNLDDPGDRENTLAFVKEPPSEDNTAQDNSKTIYTIKFLDEAPGIVLPLRNQGTVRFITVANRGHSMKEELTTEVDKNKIYLEDLWEYGLLTSTWSGSGQDVSDGYDRFVMTTAYDDADTDSFIKFTNESGDGTESSPFRGKTTLQRMCARIDVMYEDDNLKTAEGKKELRYPAGTSGNTVHITNMLPVNVMYSPSYLFKNVTTGIPTVWTEVTGRRWGGWEKTDEGQPSNYVIEPNTLLKENFSDDDLTTSLTNWYKDTRTAKVKYETILSEENGTVGGYHHYKFNTKYDDSKTYTNIAVLGYCNENTQSPNQYNSNYLTGIAFRAVYVPKEICGADGNPVTVGNDDEFEFIYRYSKSSQSQEENDCKYFLTEDAIKQYMKLTDNLGDVPVVTPFTATKHDGTLGFVCYYNLWLKHYDDVDDTDHSDPHAVFPMQYATVRNNIYRVGLKFNGPGDPTPTMREPETMQARIFVRKWNLREEKDPLLF